MGMDLQSVEEVKEFFLRLPMFFVATAPSECDGLVNVSPKGFDGTLAFIDPDIAAKVTNGVFPGSKSMGIVAYCDIGGSGIETVAHLRSSPRITIMGTNLVDPLNPRIVRMYGNGYVVERGQSTYDQMVNCFLQSKNISGDYKKGWQLPLNPEQCRNFILIDVNRVRDSCGGGVPVFKFVAHRDYFDKYKDLPPEKEILDKLMLAWSKTSLDGLPGLVSFQKKQRNWISLPKMRLFFPYWRQRGNGLYIAFSIAFTIIAFILGYYTQRSTGCECIC